MAPSSSAAMPPQGFSAMPPMPSASQPLALMDKAPVPSEIQLDSVVL